MSPDNPSETFVILAAYGIGQERLATRGLNREVTDPAPGDPSRREATTLREVDPDSWRNVDRDERR
ncbi:MAG: hypothetical protein ACR2QB_12010 [Gammaproteobacteria bacterium]